MRAFDHDDLARKLIGGHYRLVEAELEAILAGQPDHPAALLMLARAAGMRGDRARELECACLAADADGAAGEAHALHARCLARAQKDGSADEAITRALLAERLSDVALDDLATACRQLGRHQDAADLLRRAVEEGSRNPAVFFNLGNNLRFVGEFEEARDAYERALEMAPAFHKVHAALATLGESRGSASLPNIEALIARCGEDVDAIAHLRHAASKLCDALGRYDEAWRHLETGKAAVVAAVGADPLATVPWLDALCQRLEHDPPAFPRAETSGGPILIVGMPRTGTTVIDRIVSNHADVSSIGESMYFARLIKERCGSRTSGLLDAEMMAAIDDDALLGDAGKLYEERGKQLIGSSKRFLDKFHMNFMLAPHLVRAIPTAKILWILRDPLDTIVGNFRQLFDFRSDIYRYSLDIEAAAIFLVRFRRLAELMEAQAPGNVRLVSYESVVADPEGFAREMLRFCDLPWQPGCSRIERNTASVATASSVQVRSPISRDYVGRWRRYERHLSGAALILRSAGLIK